MDYRRQVLRERVKERLFVLLTLQIRAGVVSVSGTTGYILELDRARTEVAQYPGSEVVIKTRRLWYFLSGTGQVVETIREWFPEVVPYMDRNMKCTEPSDLDWMKMYFPMSRDVPDEDFVGRWEA